MDKRQVIGAYFSPTKSTEKVVCHIAKGIGDKMGFRERQDDFTNGQARVNPLTFTSEDLVVFGVPVYAGRVPNVLLDYLHRIKGNGAYAIAVVLYGNRSFDDALAELVDILTYCDLHVIAAGAFVGAHAFSRTLAAGRPDREDLRAADKLVEVVCDAIEKNHLPKKVLVPGRRPATSYYIPRDEIGNAIDILRVKPCVGDTCDGCGKCAILCPMESIDYENIRQYTGICIKCGACIKGCPQKARYYEDSGYLYHLMELEKLTTRALSKIWY